MSVVFSRASQRTGVPIALLFLLVGMLAGSEGLGGIAFDDYRFAFRLGAIALALILFDGGLNTPLGAVRKAWAPAGLLATLGVARHRLLVAAGGRLLGPRLAEALLLGAVVSSTDAAAVFSVLRGSGLQLKRRVGLTLEVESGVNDPMAVILTTTLTQNLLHPGTSSPLPSRLEIALQLVVGAPSGVGIGYGGRLLLSPAAPDQRRALSRADARARLPRLRRGHARARQRLPGGLCRGTGAGQRTAALHAGLLRVHDALAWLSQIGMFLILGLLVYPSRLLEVAGIGLALSLVLAFVVRPPVVALCLLPFRYPRRELLFIGWIGLRGAVPIVLATFPVLAGAPGAGRIFDLVFFIVVASAVVPGATVAWATRRLGLHAPEPPAPQAVLAVESRMPLQGELLSFYIDEAVAVAGVALEELEFPDGAAVALIVRGDALIPAKGATVLRPGDHVYLIAQQEDLPLIRLMFGRAEAE